VGGSHSVLARGGFRGGDDVRGGGGVSAMKGGREVRLQGEEST